MHAAQTRKDTDGIPYLGHLLGVAALVIDDRGDEDEAIGALLHDAAEDQGGWERLEDIHARFGERVARIVDGCTDTHEDPRPPWPSRKEQYLARLRDEPAEVLRVSCADKLHGHARGPSGTGRPWRSHAQAGGVVLFGGGVLLRKTPTDHWIFPKGLVETAETLRQAAAREVAEETGVRVAAGPFVGSVRYTRAGTTTARCTSGEPAERSVASR